MEFRQDSDHNVNDDPYLGVHGGRFGRLFGGLGGFVSCRFMKSLNHNCSQFKQFGQFFWRVAWASYGGLRYPRLRDSIAVTISSPPMGCLAMRMTTMRGQRHRLHKDEDDDKVRSATSTSQTR
ncbi:hypothetical protein TIFTF001_027212 [Ficus carica]|uniref:Uncharacterized protein n=1 Tax=Ficus carica TaxID=3494 RepID=A0AA88DNS6_FICCA|nr:hypothetical protein TIFTF001_027212 [Ficus carica]